MADNTELNPGVGGNIISDEDIGGVHRSRVKIILGAFGVDGGDVDAANPMPVTGTGAAGVPTPLVLTIQGIAGGFPVPVMGPAAFGGAFPPDGFAGGWNDGVGSMESARVYDLDTGGGVEWAVGVNLRFSAGGGSVEAGTVLFPIQVGDAGGSLTVDTPQLPAALVGGRLDTNLGAWLGSTAPTVGQKTMAASVPVVIASDQIAVPVTPQVVGVHGNAWLAAAVGAGAVSPSIDCQYTPFVSIFGNGSAASTITMQVSQDNVNFYNAVTTAVPLLGGDFYLAATVGARYVRLMSSAAITITATIAGKD